MFVTLYAKQRKEVEEYSKKVFVDSHVVLTAPDKIKSEEKTKRVIVPYRLRDTALY